MLTSSEGNVKKGPSDRSELQSKKGGQPHPSVQSVIATGGFKPVHVGYWGLKMQRFQLVGLVQHSDPRVYLTDKPLNKQDGNVAPTRELDEFETSALNGLRGGDQLKVEERDGTIRMLGPIFAGQRCVECHQRGQMLGAFSYVMQRDPNFDSTVPRP